MFSVQTWWQCQTSYLPLGKCETIPLNYLMNVCVWVSDVSPCAFESQRMFNRRFRLGTQRSNGWWCLQSEIVFIILMKYLSVWHTDLVIFLSMQFFSPVIWNDGNFFRPGHLLALKTTFSHVSDNLETRPVIKPH